MLAATRKIIEKISDSGRVALRCSNERISFDPHDASRVYDAIRVLDQRAYEYQQKGLSTAAVEQLRDYVAEYL